MKQIFSLFLFVILFSCKENNEALTIVKKNNIFFKEEFENCKESLKEKSNENSHFIESYKNFIALSNGIYILKNQEDYDKIFNQIIKINNELITKCTLESIKSENPEILKNNLFLNVTKLFTVYPLRNSTIISTRCGSSFIYSNEKEKLNDSVIFKFKTLNYNFNIDEDSIIEDGKSIKKEIEQKKYILTTYKYKSNAKKSVFYGKVIMKDAQENPYIIKNIKETIHNK